MSLPSGFWRRGGFGLTAAACTQFVVLTALAMLVYPGGTAADPSTRGYSFFTNFFSDLGRTVSPAGQPNTVSMVLFVVALTLAGAGLALFFVAFTQFFARSVPGRILSWLGTLFGVIAGICFVGVAFTPANVYRDAHGQFVLWAFGAFPIAAVLYTIAMLREPGFPKRYALVFAAFAALLVLYFVLIQMGPGFDTPQGLIIQATGQKVIVYASIVSILIESLGARRIAVA